MSCSLISCMSRSGHTWFRTQRFPLYLAAFFREAKFLVNVAQLANEGIIISWGKTSERPARLENRSNDATERNLLARKCMIWLFLVSIDIQRMWVQRPFAYDSHIEHEHHLATLVSMGFQRDQNFEKELRLFAGVSRMGQICVMS